MLTDLIQLLFFQSNIEFKKKNKVDDVYLFYMLFIYRLHA